VVATSLFTTFGSHTAEAQSPGLGAVFDCSADVVYGTTNTGSIYSMATDQIGVAANQTPTAASAAPGFTGANALAITPGGAAAYVVSYTGSASDVEEYDPVTSTWAQVATAPTASYIKGAVDPFNGNYYFATSTNQIYVLDTADNTVSSTAITVTVSGETGSQNGDFAFDAVGDLFLSTGTTLSVVPEATLAAGGTITATNISAALPASPNGLAFNADGELFAGTSGDMYDIDPTTGAQIGVVTAESVSFVDLASCGYGPSLKLQKDITSRFTPTDQFDLAITGGGVASGNTATTSGTTLGVQPVEAGPVPVVDGTTYTFTETAASGSLSNYLTSYDCVDTATGDSSIPTSPVSSTSFTVTLPNPSGADGQTVLCTFTNTAIVPPTLKVTKALGGTRFNSGDQFTTQIRTGSATGPVVNSTTNSTTTGSGSTVTNGTGTTGVFTATAGTTYYVTEAGADGADLADYTSTITCTDSSGYQTGLPDNAPFSGSIAITPVDNAVISCVLTNTSLARPTVTKTFSPTTISVGDTSQLTLTLSNSNAGAITDVADSDTFPAGLVVANPNGLTSTCGGTATAIAGSGSESLSGGAIAGASSCTISLDVTSLTGGTYTNTIPAGGVTSSAGDNTDPASADLFVADPGLTIVKSVTSTGPYDAVGQTVGYQFVVTNTGDVTLTSVGVDDTQTAPAGALTSGPTCVSVAPSGSCTGSSSTTLTPGQSATFTATYTLTQADLDNGSVDDSATASGTPPTGSPVTSSPSTASVATTSDPGLTIVKSVTSTGPYDAVGQTVGYQFVVSNTGNVTLTSVGVDDTQTAPAGALSSGPTCVSGSCTGSSSTTLAPGQSATFTATYTLTQADLDNGSVDDSATASGNPPTGSPVMSSPSTASVATTSNPALTIVKSVTSTGPYDAVGQTVAYQFVVSNTGNVTLTSVGVDDTQTAPAGALSSGPTCQSVAPSGSCTGSSSTTLTPGQSATFTATYALTQADLNNGSVADSATASGTPPTGSPVTSSPSTAAVPTSTSTGITITKSVTSTGPYDAVGQTVGYQFVVSNTGNVTLTSVGVDDTQTAPAGALSSGPTCQSVAPSGSCTTASSTTLAPGQSATFTATYTLTQADLNKGSVADSATATGTPPTGSPITSSPSTASVTTTSNPALSIVKSVTSTGPYDAVGQTVAYKFVVTDTGNVTLTSVGVDDAQTAPAGALSSGPTCQSVAPSGSCTTASSTTLAPGQSATFTATYTLTQADLNKGSVADSATSTGTPPTGSPVTSSPSTASVALTANPGLSVVKSVTSTGPYDAVGQTVAYKFVVTDTGNVTLTSTGVDDTQTAPAGALSSGPTCQSVAPSGTCTTASSTTLAPGQSATFTATYTLTQADLNKGSVADSATSTGTPPTGSPVTSSPSTASVTTTSNPALSIVKSVTSTGPYDAVGQTVAYKFVVSNTGNVTLTSTGVDDTQTAPAGALTSGPTCQSVAPSGSCTSTSSTTLAPGQSATFTATYALTQADLNNGSVADSATSTGTPPTGSPITSSPSTAAVATNTSTGITIVKSVTSSGPYDAVGQTVVYKFLVSNAGNVTLTSVGVHDTQTAPAGPLTSGPTCQSVAPSGSCTTTSSTTLTPGQSATFTATYTLTQADLDNGNVADSATASGTPPTGSPITSSPSTASLPITAEPGLSIVKSVTSTGPYDAVGQTVAYKFVVTDTGNVTLTSTGVDDTQTPPAGPLTSGPSCQSVAPSGSCTTTSSTTLTPGQSATFTATYTLTQADLNNGSVADSATATGTPPTGSPVTSSPSTAAVATNTSTGITVVKSVTSTGPYDAAGQTIAYQFVVTDAGNVTLTSVGVHDTQSAPAGALTSGPTCQSVAPSGSCTTASSTTLTPGQSATFTATYTLTQADLDNGSVADSAIAIGTPPTGSPITSQPSTLSVATSSNPALTTVKSVTSTGPYDTVGQTIAYQFAVTNTGNVTLTSVGVDDTQTAPAGSLTSGPSCQSVAPSGSCTTGSTTTLTPGQSATFTATYTLTQADLNNGSVADSATATGTPPTGSPITSQPSTLSVATSSNPALTTVKSVTSTGPYDAVGQTIAYQFVVTNTGNVTLTSVGVDDTQSAPAGTLTSGPTCQSVAPSGSCTSTSSTTLTPGQSATFTATYTLTQADLDNGSVADSATASGTPPTGSPITSPPSTASVPLTANPGLSVVKSVTSTGPYDTVGQTIAYKFVVTDTGNVTLTAVGVDDSQSAPAGALSSGPTCQSVAPSGSCTTATSTTLSPGEVATFTATYKLTEADLDNGSVADSATASGTPPSGTPITSQPSTVAVPAAPAPILSVSVKKEGLVTPSSDQTSLKLGDTITYSYLVTNTGNVDLVSVAVADPTLGAVSCPTPAAPGLAPGQSETCTADEPYLVNQSDVAAGSVNDVATAVGKETSGAETPVSPPSAVSLPAGPDVALSLTKTPSRTSFSAAGQEITYSYKVTNTGNVALGAVTVTDPMHGLSALDCPATTLAPGADEVCTAAYTTTTADVDAGAVSNTGTARGTYTHDGTTVSATAQSKVVVEYVAPPARISPIVPTPIQVTG
jgi:uncharacterized repeat protein (TIGR01451 family)